MGSMKFIILYIITILSQLCFISYASSSLDDNKYPLKKKIGKKVKNERSRTITNPKKEPQLTSKSKSKSTQQTNKNSKAYMTTITTDREVDKSLVMLSSLFAMTKTIEKPVWERHRRSKINNNRYVNSSDIDYICMVLPKESIDDYNEAWEIFDLGVSHRNIQKLIWAGCQIRPIPYPILNPDYDINDANHKSNDSNSKNDKNKKGRKEDSSERDTIWDSINYNQIWAWSLQDHYETIIYIHHDFLILSNINHLFDRHEEFKSSNDTIHNNRPFIAAAANNVVTNQFDSGFMIIQPDTPLFQDMSHFIRRGEVGGLYDENRNVGAGSSIEVIQKVSHFLNDMIFPDWFSMSPVHRLEPMYNTPYEWTFHPHTWLSHRTEIHIFHFTEYYKPVNIIANPKKYQISKYAAPLIYLWSLIMFFVTRPLVNMEEETRYALYEVFHSTMDSDDILAYMERMKRGGTRRRLESQIYDNDHSGDEL